MLRFQEFKLMFIVLMLKLIQALFVKISAYLMKTALEQWNLITMETSNTLIALSNYAMIVIHV